MPFRNPFRSSSNRMGQSSSQPAQLPDTQTANAGGEDDLWIGSSVTTRPNDRTEVIPSSVPPPQLDEPSKTAPRESVPAQDKEADELWVSPQKSLNKTNRWSLGQLLSITPGRKEKTTNQGDEGQWQSFIDARDIEAMDVHHVVHDAPHVDVSRKKQKPNGTKRKAGEAYQEFHDSARNGPTATSPAPRQKRRKVTNDEDESTDIPMVAPITRKSKTPIPAPSLELNMRNDGEFPTPPYSESPSVARSRTRKSQGDTKIPQKLRTTSNTTFSSNEANSNIDQVANHNDEDGDNDENDHDDGDDENEEEEVHDSVAYHDNEDTQEDGIFVHGDDSDQLYDSSEVEKKETKSHSRVRAKASKSGNSGSGLDTAASGGAGNEPPYEIRTSGPFTRYETYVVENRLSEYCDMRNISREDAYKMIQCKERGKQGNPELWEELFESLAHRENIAIRRFCRRRFNTYEKRGKWSASEDKELAQAYSEKPDKWSEIGKMLGRMPEDCRDRWRNYVKHGNKRRRTDYWTLREEIDLSYAVAEVIDALKEHAKEKINSLGTPLPETNADWEKRINWDAVSDKMNNTRSRLQCLQHWQTMAQRESSRASSMMEDSVQRSASWRRTAADKSFERMMVGDKVQILLQIQDSQATSEDNIPWTKIAVKANDAWNTMDRKNALFKMKSLLKPKQVRRNTLSQNLNDLMDYFEEMHPDEINQFYDPASSQSSRQGRDKMTGRFTSDLEQDRNESEDGDEVNMPPPPKPSEKRQERVKTSQSSDLPHIKTGSSVNGAIDAEKSQEEVQGDMMQVNEDNVMTDPQALLSDDQMSEDEEDEAKSSDSDEAESDDSDEAKSDDSNEEARVAELKPEQKIIEETDQEDISDDDDDDDDEPTPARPITTSSESNAGSESEAEEDVEDQSDSGSSSEESSESADEPNDSLIPNSFPETHIIPPTNANLQENDDAESVASSDFNYDSPHEPVNSQDIQLADKEACADANKHVPWTQIRYRWESRTRQILSPDSFQKRINALRLPDSNHPIKSHGTESSSSASDESEDDQDEDNDGNEIVGSEGAAIKLGNTKASSSAGDSSSGQGSSSDDEESSGEESSEDEKSSEDDSSSEASAEASANKAVETEEDSSDDDDDDSES